MNRVSTRKALGEAHSKLILVGEHAVVYGKPAIAIPFPLKVRSIVEESSGNIMFESAVYTGPIDSMPMRMKGISECIKETLHYLGKPLEGLRIRIDSAIPLGRGLGSSAAVAVALVRSLFSFCGQEPSQRELFSFVQIAETHAHGKPSGIDMAAVSSECPIWFEREKEPIPVKTNGPLYIVASDTGRIGDTRIAVENVRKRYLLEPEKVEKSLEKIGKIVDEAKNALLNGDMYLLGQLLNRNQEELISLGVSDDGLNRLIERARNAGALGAKLTGGGLGGCMIALADSLESARIISSELMKSGAFRSWYFSSQDDSLYASQEVK
ncbi:mevalonate kinase [Fonticella tunisiensis]|uniref:mevalonate kinase n=1 Tax=Fonticella tunisiensis TaxID=1096341 RepID=A0A4R7KSR1_9CLOT|nr:mevalonate kinase [Fonticella tunisiensis]TDT62847.1 mevalonate kinase [Fonticella tunisiensis]